MAAAKRIYAVTVAGSDKVRLIRAVNSQQARAFACRDIAKAELATQDQLLAMAGTVAVEES